MRSKEKNGMKEMLHYRLNVKGYVKQKTCAVERRGTNKERERERKKERENSLYSFVSPRFKATD